MGTYVNFSKLVGKRVLVGFKQGAPLYVARSEGDKLAPMLVQTPEGQMPISLPFLPGEVVAIDDLFALQYTERDVLGPQGDPTKKYVSVLSPDAVATVTYVVEQKIALIGAS